MSDPERLKTLLAEAKEQVEKMDFWMKSQEPPPGDSYEEWIVNSEREESTAKRNCTTKML